MIFRDTFLDMDNRRATSLVVYREEISYLLRWHEWHEYHVGIMMYLEAQLEIVFEYEMSHRVCIKIKDIVNPSPRESITELRVFVSDLWTCWK